MMKECITCKYKSVPNVDVPCNSCKICGGEEDNREPKDELQEMKIEYRGCDNCKHVEVSDLNFPCKSCKRNGGEKDNWEPANDNVNHPSHYENFCSLECIEAMELIFGKEFVYNFCLLNSWKYIWRYKHKNGTEDLKKARWYIDRCKKYIEHTCVYADFGDMVDNIDQWLLSHNIVQR